MINNQLTYKGKFIVDNHLRAILAAQAVMTMLKGDANEGDAKLVPIFAIRAQSVSSRLITQNESLRLSLRAKVSRSWPLRCTVYGKTTP